MTLCRLDTPPRRKSFVLASSLALGLCSFATAAVAQPPAGSPAGSETAPAPGPAAPLVEPRETHFAGLTQLTDGGENAEAYWSPDSTELILQSQRPPFSCDQIFRLRADGTGQAVLVSTGKGRTTCSYFLAGGRRVIYSSTHAAAPECPPPADRSQGYVWPIYPTYEIWSARPDGSDLARVTDNAAYDAESTVCPKDGSIIFTSTRDGDLDLYRMDADGSHVRRLTSAPGYDGGAFFSPDCSRIVWRASRPKAGKELDDYRALLARGLVRPTKLELWIGDADGANARQLTYLDAASFAPSFFPDGKRIIFSSNAGDPGGREFDLWAIDADGTHLERITWTPGFDGFPMFSPDGTRLAFSSNRHDAKPGETNVFVARWTAAAGSVSPEPADAAAGPSSAAADRYEDDVRWLADDKRQGRGIGTTGLAQSAEWLFARFRKLGLAPAGETGGFLQGFDVPVSVGVEPATAVAVDGRPLDRAAFQPAGFSSSLAPGAAPVEADVVAAGHGITAPELGVDDYQGIDAHGKIVVVRRFTPEGGHFAGEDAQRRYGDLRFKAWNAREHGAAGLIVVDQPAAAADPGTKAAPGSTAAPAPAEAPLPAVVPEAPLPAVVPEAPLPAPSVDTQGDAGLPVVVVTRAAGSPLFTGSHRAALAIALHHETARAVNVVGVLRAGAADRLPGAVLLGAHYDHLGLGGTGSLAPDSHEPHNGADDNASGTAALLEAARLLAEHRAGLRRDVYFVAFSGEEEGTLGSTAFTRQPPSGLALTDLIAMVNMDMVGRLRDNRLTVLGGESAEGWADLVQPACARELLTCSLSGDGYGPSDHTPFYAAGVPVLHFFTGSHSDYHKPSDDADKINAAGGARVAALAADLVAAIADRPERPVYKSAAAPAPQGDVRSYGATLGTIPDYAGPADGRPGVLLAGVRPGSAAEKAGLARGDLLVELAGTPIRDIYDFTFVLRRAKPGETAKAVVERGGQRLSLDVTFGGGTVR